MGSKSANEKGYFGNKALLYIEYKEPKEAVDIYQKLLNKYNFQEKENRVLVRQNSLRIQLERSRPSKYDDQEPLIREFDS